MGRAGSQKITSVGQTVLARLIETLIWHLHESAVGEGSAKEQWILPALLFLKLTFKKIYWCF